jgi:Tol biopolymer transport system component
VCLAAAAWLAGGVLWVETPPAGAAFPGADGDIAFVSTRNDTTAIYQVDPNYAGAAGAGLGTATGDAAATTGLTVGAVDAEPFYSPDGSQVFFSSDRSGHWAIYDIAQSSAVTATATTDGATELSQVSGGEAHDDYAPSVGPDGDTVVFNRDNTALFTLDTAMGPSSDCLLYKPPRGLAPASSDNGSGSRAVFDPVDPSELLYVSAKGHIHLLTGIPTLAGSNPCGVTRRSLVNTDLSAEAAHPRGDGIKGAVDADPDWSPDGTKVVFDSTRGGGHTLWILTMGTHPSVAPVWPSLAVPGGTSDTQPVFSPDGNAVAYTQPVSGSQVVDYEVDQVGDPHSAETDLTESPGTPTNSQPDWQPALAAALPESPLPVLLPPAGILTVVAVVMLRRRRSARRTPGP